MIGVTFMSVTENVRELAAPILESLGLELFDLQFRKGGNRSLVQIFIDKEGGVTLEDCQRASQEIGMVLDLKDAVPGSYNLEVSSPGINRPIRDRQDYQRYKGSKIKVKLFAPMENRKTVIGINRGIEEETLRLEIAPNREILIPIVEIAGASLEVDF